MLPKLRHSSKTELNHHTDRTLPGHEIRKRLSLNHTAYFESSATGENFSVIAIVWGCETPYTLMGTWKKIDYSKKKTLAKFRKFKNAKNNLEKKPSPQQQKTPSAMNRKNT